MSGDASEILRELGKYRISMDLMLLYQATVHCDNCTNNRLLHMGRQCLDPSSLSPLGSMPMMSF